MSKKSSNDFVTLTVSVPKEIFDELRIRIPEGERSRFLRDAIVNGLEKIPKTDKLLEFEGQLQKFEEELGQIKKYLADLEILTYDGVKVDPYAYCTDDMDKQIIDYLLQHDGATTQEASTATGRNRWLILNRLKRIEKQSTKKIGKPIVSFVAIQKGGKKRAWWINRDLIR